MTRRLVALATAAIIGLGFLVPRSAPAAASAPLFNPPKQYYLALGDAQPYGFQLAKLLAQVPNVDPASFNTGYVDDFSAMLRKIRPDIQTVNYSCPQESTISFLGAAPCIWFLPPYGFSRSTLHNPYPGSQMDAALAFLHAHPGQVSPITLTLGGVDAALLHQPMDQIQGRLGQIVGALRQAAPDAEIIMMQYYNAAAVADPSSNALTQALNAVIANVAGANGARLADTFTPYNLSSPQPQMLCKLTLFCTPLQDIHATDLGYSVSAEQFWKASGYDRLAGMFLSGFSSSQPGQGFVYFGSGPGCMGLVEVGTGDIRPWTTSHAVIVSGNDLPGSVGDNGLQPGATYWYENVTLTRSGVEIDNNGGKCYSVTLTKS